MQCRCIFSFSAPGMGGTDIHPLPPCLQAAYELEMSSKISHPGIMCARSMFVVWTRPRDLLGPEHCEDFASPDKKCLLLVQEMDYIKGRTLEGRLDAVRFAIRAAIPRSP